MGEAWGMDYSDADRRRVERDFWDYEILSAA